MITDRAANRTHGLSAPPPVRENRLLPNHGCIACVPRGCAYRRAYACQDDERGIGLALGYCAIELMRRAALKDDFLEYLHDLEGEDLDRAESLLELLLDAAVYSERSMAWLNHLWNERVRNGKPGYEDPDVYRAVARYREGAVSRLVLRISRLRSFVAIARTMQARSGGVGTKVA